MRLHDIFPKALLAALHKPVAQMQVSAETLAAAGCAAEEVWGKLGTTATGLSAGEAAGRLARQGPNSVGREQRFPRLRIFLHAVVNPLVVLLSLLAGLSFVTGDARAGTVMIVMVALGVVLRFVQEAKADTAAARLKAMISVTATVVRDGAAAEIPVSHIVRGDLVKLAAGDMIPGDVRLVGAKDLFIVQGALTGESFPVEKFAEPDTQAGKAAVELRNICYLGTSVESGSGSGVVVATGMGTYLGSMAETLAGVQPPTAFDKGVSSFTWLMIRFMAVMVPVVFVVNGITKRNWTEAFFFALAVAVGLTPEMLPMIVTVCLSKGAIAMSRKQVIVKRLNSIQNLGAMDVLCTDKTGTLTDDHVILERYCDVASAEDEGVLELAFLNSHFQTGLKSVLDRAVLDHEELHHELKVAEHEKVDEIPFDFQRRMMSVAVRMPAGKVRLITKGAPEAVFARCTRFELKGDLLPMDPAVIDDLREEYEKLSADGFRVLAIAFKVEAGCPAFSRADECGLVLKGYVAFLDPPKESAKGAIAALQGHGVRVKVITGDNELVSRKICTEVGIGTAHVLLGSQVAGMTEEQLADAAEETTLFARMSPGDKQRVIRALRSRKHVVGFMGDGINDAPALRAADVGISMDTAVDIAKESADAILLEKSLLVLQEGVLEGRRVFANILKYVRMGASSSFGNMVSVLGASVWLPYLPMAPVQILSNNLLYDFSQVPIPTDATDAEQVERPRPWSIGQITRFILFIGPCSSLFDYTTFAMMWWVFECNDLTLAPAGEAGRFAATLPVGNTDGTYAAHLFQTGWFVESLLTQTLIIHVIRTNRIPFLQSRASAALTWTSVAVAAAAVVLPYVPLGRALGFVALPWLYWPLLGVTLAAYVALTQGVKSVLLRKGWI